MSVRKEQKQKMIQKECTPQFCKSGNQSRTCRDKPWVETRDKEKE